ncbi:YihY/virulence factor BrkB family protein [Parachlamydia sp.]|jgi:membrane protein
MKTIQGIILMDVSSLFSQWKPSKLLKKIVRISKAAVWGFIEHDCYAKSASLAFYTLLSIVPVLAVAFGIAKGFGFQDALESSILEKFQENKEITRQILEFANNTLHHAESSVIAGFGVLILFWSVFSLLGSIETSLNVIWHIKIARSIGKKITHYLTLIILSPLLLAIGSSAIVFLAAQIRIATQAAIGTAVIHPVMVVIVNFFSLVVSWILFSAIYLLIPNTQVQLRYGVFAGIIAGTFYQIVQWIYIHIQIYLSSYGAVYGSLAAIPLFFIWLQISWLIVLMGAELAFNAESDALQYSFASDKPEMVSKNSAALLIVKKCMESLIEGRSPLSILTLTRELGIPLENTLDLTDSLTEGGILLKIQSDSCYQGFQPALPLRELTYQRVLQAIEKDSIEQIAIRPSLYLDEIRDNLKKLDEAHANLTIPLLPIQF